MARRALWRCALLTLSALGALDARPAGAQARDTAPGEVPLQPRPDPWQVGDARWFAAARVDGGFPFLRAEGSVGYGRPHFLWSGLEAGPAVTTTAVAGFVGARFEHPVVDLRSDLEFVQSIRQTQLAPAAHFDRRDLDLQSGPRARYWSWDTRLELELRLGPGAVLSETQPVYTRAPDPERFLFLDLHGVITDPGWIARQRLGYQVQVRAITGLRVAVVGEGVWLEGRDAGVWRAGALARWWLFKDLEMRLEVLPVVASPDALGSRGGTPLRWGLRYQWATGG